MEVIECLILVCFTSFIWVCYRTACNNPWRGWWILYVPILTLFGVTPQVAVATSLVTVLPTTAAGAYSHHRMGNIDIRKGLILGVGGIIGTLIGHMLQI